MWDSGAGIAYVFGYLKPRWTRCYLNWSMASEMGCCGMGCWCSEHECHRNNASIVAKFSLKGKIRLQWLHGTCIFETASGGRSVACRQLFSHGIRTQPHSLGTEATIESETRKTRVLVNNKILKFVISVHLSLVSWIPFVTTILPELTWPQNQY